MRTYLLKLFAISVFISWNSATLYAAELEEVIVTAQKREQSLQDVSLAVTAFTQEGMSRIGANNVERLDLLTPGMEWGQFGLGAKVSIRGQGVANFEANTDGPVGTFVDGIYLGRGQQAWTVLSDIERVEVLRGPQGTLFGRNTDRWQHQYSQQQTDKGIRRQRQRAGWGLFIVRDQRHGECAVE